MDWRWRNSRFVRHSIPWDRTCKRDRGIVRVQNLDPRIDTHIRVCVQDLESLVRGKLAQSRFYILLIKSSFSSSTAYSIYVRSDRIGSRPINKSLGRVSKFSIR